MENILILLLASSLLFSCKKEEAAQTPTVFKASGDITATVNEFRNNLGTLNTTPGAGEGRREINWDGIPDSLLDHPLANDFFNTVGDGIPASRQRGLRYDDGEFQASGNGFAAVNGEAASELKAFSGTKVFANVSALEWPVQFQVAGTATPASVKAFGAVFTDVDVEGSVTLQFFNGNKSLGTFNVPAHNAASSFSFLGVKFTDNVITKVRVHHQGVLRNGGKDVSQGGATDLIAVDDLIYSEPRN